MSGAESSTHPTQEILLEFRQGIDSLAPLSKAQITDYFAKNPNQAYPTVHAIMTGAHYFDTQLNQTTSELQATRAHGASLQGTVEELQRVQANVETIQSTMANLEGQVRARDHTISQLQMPAEVPAAPESPAPALSNTNQPTRTTTFTERIPDSEKFNSNCPQLCSFLGQLRMKLLTNHDHFPDEQSKIIYTLSLSDRTVVLIVAPLLDTGVLPCNRIEDLVALLEALYGDPERQGTAKRELDSLRQANREFVAYYAGFQRIMANLDYSEQAKIHAFVDGLSMELREALVTQHLPATLMEYVTLLTRLDN